MHRRHLWLVALVALLGAIAFSATASARVAGAKAGGTLVFGAEQEPPCLNPLFNDCNNTWANYVDELVFRGAYMVQPDFSYKLDLMSSVKLQFKPMRLTYTIRKNAKWSDGKPVTAQDMVFTLRMTMDKSLDNKPQGSGVVSRTGYELINRVKVRSSKSVTFYFKAPFADWKDLFSYVYPQHIFAGKDASTVWFNGPTIADGPFKFVSWSKGSQLVLAKNPGFYGQKAKLNQLVWRFLTNSNTEIQQVRGGEVDAIYPQPQLALADLRQAPGLRVQSSLGAQYEHLDIQQGPKGNPLAKNVNIRRALMMSINRPALIKTLFSKLNPSLKPLDNVIYLNNQKTYQKHFNKWNYNPTKAKSLLTAAGCSRSGGGIYSCGGTKLSFRFESTAGNQLRELAFTIIQQQLAQNGIEVTNDFKPSRIAFGQDLGDGNYELFMFAWSGSPDPTGNTAIWACPNAGGTQNFMNYCNARATALMKKADQTLNPVKRAALENKADALLANDVPSVPLYQKPTFLVYHSYVKGMRDNATSAGPFYNAENWSIQK